MKAISKLMLGQISKEQFLEINAISNIADVVEKGLEEAYKNQNADNVDQFMYLGFVFDVFDIKNVNILNKLLLSNWHYKHEDIALLLQRISSVESIEYLFNAIDLQPQYMKMDENYPFEVKCTRAIYYIGKEKSLPYLKKLCEHPNDIISEMAKRQIKKLM